MRVQWRHDDHIIYTFIYYIGETSFNNHSWEKVWNYRIGNCIFGLDCFSVFPKYFSKISKLVTKTLKNLFFVNFFSLNQKTEFEREAV